MRHNRELQKRELECPRINKRWDAQPHWQSEEKKNVT